MASEAKKENSTESIELLKAELDQAKKELEQYKNAYKEQSERYDRLFGLFASNIDYYVRGQRQGN